VREPGHALAGDYNNCIGALDRPHLLQGATEQLNSMPVIGASYVSDPVAVVAGWCLYDLGHPAQAVEVLGWEVARKPQEARRSCGALHHAPGPRATAGNVDRACELAHQLVAALREIDSETALCDVRSLAAIRRRWHNHAAVRDLDPVLTEARVRRIVPCREPAPA
jgi:hypothetical protein